MNLSNFSIGSVSQKPMSYFILMWSCSNQKEKQWHTFTSECTLYCMSVNSHYVMLGCASMFELSDLIQHTARQRIKLDSYPVLVDDTFMYGWLDLNVQRKKILYWQCSAIWFNILHHTDRGSEDKDSHSKWIVCFSGGLPTGNKCLA